MKPITAFILYKETSVTTSLLSGGESTSNSVSVAVEVDGKELEPTAESVAILVRIRHQVDYLLGRMVKKGQKQFPSAAPPKGV